MEATIGAELSRIEQDEQVKIVYACESGSRAWGFPSANSDYDVRFLYLRPVDWYLSIDEKRDVIERPIDADLDVSGWDLKKALRLFRKSNPPLLEWLGSPIVYRDEYDVAARMRDLIPVYYAPTACLHHYLHMARGNFRDYLRGDEIWTKKYFYVLRPLLAMQWIEQGLGVAPTHFGVLLDQLVADPALRLAIDNLLEAKLAGDELAHGPRIDVISLFVERELERWERRSIEDQKRLTPTDTLDELFRSSLIRVWASADA